MFKKRRKRLYTKADINKAYSMGLEKAVVVLEASMLLSQADRYCNPKHFNVSPIAHLVYSKR